MRLMIRGNMSNILEKKFFECITKNKVILHFLSQALPVK